MSDQRGSFEPYPFEAIQEPLPPGEPEGFGDVRPPGPAILPQPAPVRQSRPGVGRRALLTGAAAVLGIGVAGALGLRVNSGGAVETIAEASEVPEYGTEMGEDGGYATLETSQTEIGVDVPAGWTVEGEGQVVVVSGPSGVLVARSPERATASPGDLAREAEYVRDAGYVRDSGWAVDGGFEPSGEPQLTDESTTRYDILVQRTAGTVAGSPATETVTLMVNPEIETSLVIWWVAADSERQVNLEVRSMESQLRRGFEDS